jgi:hypothetical protein
VSEIAGLRNIVVGAQFQTDDLVHLDGVPVKDRSWPVPAAGGSVGLKTGMGQLRTLAAYRCHVCFQG